MHFVFLLAADVISSSLASTMNSVSSLSIATTRKLVHVVYFEK